jgi:hypothetical protein
MPETESQPTAENGDQPAGATAETDWKAEARKWETRAKDHQKRISELEPKAKQAEAFEQASKSDAERFQERVAELSKEAEDARSDAIRFRVAAEFKIEPADVDLLGSGSEDDIRGRAERARSAVRPRQTTARGQASPGRLAGLLGDGRSPENDAANWLQQLVRK